MTNSHLQHSRIIAKEDDSILGWAALTPVSGRCVYAVVVFKILHYKNNQNENSFV